MKWKYNDGGRKNAGFKGKANDCVCRAICIAGQLDYTTVYNRLNEAGAKERTSKRRAGKSNARTGVHISTIRKFLANLGWVWVPTMGIGTGCKVHLRDGELPRGRLIVNLSKHTAAVINGVIFDTDDPSRDGTRCVYGYWYKPAA